MWTRDIRMPQVYEHVAPKRSEVREINRAQGRMLSWATVMLGWQAAFSTFAQLVACFTYSSLPPPPPATATASAARS